MSARMQVPLSQRRHTNVAVVRYTRKGVRLEIACYKNKVISYRSGTEDRLDEVLQVDRIFSNVSRGHIAPEKDIQAVFGPNMSTEDAIKYMLIHGELQVAQHERTAEVDEIFKDIALIISQKCINSNTQRPFPCFVIEQALREIGAGVKLDQPAKKQALSLIHQLVESQIIPISRANMKLRCSTRTAAAIEKLRTWCDAHNAQIVEVVKTDPAGTELATDLNDGAETYSVLLLMQPNFYGVIESFIKAELPNGSTVHVVEASVMAAGESDGASFLAAAKDQSAVSTACSALEIDLKPSGGYKSTKGFEVTSSSFQEVDMDQGMKQKQHQKAAKSTKEKRRKNASSGDKLEEDPSVPSPGDHYEKDIEGSSVKRKANEYENVVGRGMKKGDGGDSHTGDGEEDGMDAYNDPLARNLGAVKDELVVQLQQLGLDPVTDLAANDSDEDGRNKRKKNAGKRKNNKNDGNTNSKKNASNAEKEREIDSDEDLEGNRKQRKRNTIKKKNDDDMGDMFDEENFDYGEEN
ncbi:unnamed protein product [Phytomonas sp. EM1]|nr:unnamed protein product [Phytomonas sp. EM1]|eukprot:CCW60565.1 unnamed protein product [Phytomonas sp. isolate EM1]